VIPISGQTGIKETISDIYCLFRIVASLQQHRHPSNRRAQEDAGYDVSEPVEVIDYDCGA
jgi:hypothetical protein